MFVLFHPKIAVTSYTDVWIETSSRPPMDAETEWVTSYTDVWIETIALRIVAVPVLT